MTPLLLKFLNKRDIEGTELKGRLLIPDGLAILEVREAIQYHTYNIGGIHIPLSMIQHIKKTD